MFRFNIISRSLNKPGANGNVLIGNRASNIHASSFVSREKRHQLTSPSRSASFTSPHLALSRKNHPYLRDSNPYPLSKNLPIQSAQLITSTTVTYNQKVNVLMHTPHRTFVSVGHHPRGGSSVQTSFVQNAAKIRSSSPALHSARSRQTAQPLFNISRRHSKSDFSKYYFFPRRRKMRFLLTRRGLIRPGRRHNYRWWTPWRRWRFVWRHLRKGRFPKLLKFLFLLLFYYYVFLYLLPYLLRWQYDITPRSITRFSLLDFEERWEHTIISKLRLYNKSLKVRNEPGSPDPNITLDGLQTPAGKPFREGLIWYYCMLVVYPFVSGIFDPILYPRMFFFGLQPLLPRECLEPTLPQNVLVTMPTRELLQFMSIIQTRMNIAANSEQYQNRSVFGPHVVYDTRNELHEFQLRAKRYRFNLPMMRHTYNMVMQELFRRIHSAVFYSGRESVLPAPRYTPELPHYELNEQELRQRYHFDELNDIDPNNQSHVSLARYANVDTDDNPVWSSTIKHQIPGLLEALQHDIAERDTSHSYLWKKLHIFSSSPQNPSILKSTPADPASYQPPSYLSRISHSIASIPSRSFHFVKNEAFGFTRECVHFLHAIFDRCTWTGPPTGFEQIRGLDSTLISHRDGVYFDPRLHEFDSPSYPLFFTTVSHYFRQMQQIIFSALTQFSSSRRTSRDILDNFQFPILHLNSDLDEIVYFLTAPEVNSHYTRMIQSLQEVEHSNNDGTSYDYRRINLGMFYDRRFKLQQNVQILQTFIDIIQNDLDIAKADMLRTGSTDGVPLLNTKQLGCEWVLYDLRCSHKEMRRILRDMEYFLQSDQANAIDPNIEPIRGDSGIVASTFNLLPFGIGNVPKNVLRRAGWIEQGSIPGILPQIQHYKRDNGDESVFSRFDQLTSQTFVPEKNFYQRNYRAKTSWLPSWLQPTDF